MAALAGRRRFLGNMIRTEITFRSPAMHRGFRKPESRVGGVAGVVIGVSDIDKSLVFYKNLLQPLEVVYDKTGVFQDLPGNCGGQRFAEYCFAKTLHPTVHSAACWVIFRLS